MSTDVYIYVTQKSDSKPMGRYYLGGNGTKNAMYPTFNISEQILDGFAITPLDNADTTERWLDIWNEHFYSDNCSQQLIEDYLSKYNANDFSYWLAFEY